MIVLFLYSVTVQLSGLDIFDAVKNGETGTIKIYLKNGGNIYEMNKNGDPLLIYAAKNGNAVAVNLFIRAIKKAKGDINARDAEGRTALMCASITGNTESVDLLIKAKAGINLTDKYGNTALILATKNGKIDVVKLLAGAGADLNIKNKDGHTALTESGLWPDIMNILLFYGAK